MSDIQTSSTLSPSDIQSSEDLKKFRIFCRQIKDGIHEDISVLLENYPRFVIKPLKYKDELNAVGASKPKIIIATPTETELDELFEQIEKIVADGNAQMEEKKKELKVKAPVKKTSYIVKKINSTSSSLNLSFSRAHKLSHMTGEKTVAWLKLCIASVSEFYRDGYEELLTLMEKGRFGLKTDDTPYCVDRFSGTAYRVTYYGEDKYRHQTNVGDVLGIFGFSELNVTPVDYNSRHTRSDLNEYIFANSVVGIRLDQKALENNARTKSS